MDVLKRAVSLVLASAVIRAPLRRFVDRLRRRAMIAQDFVPYDLHRFDRRTWVIKETAAGFRIWCSLDERAISRPILVDAYEIAESSFMKKNVGPGDVVVDAGANIGYHTLHLAKLVGQSGCVHAVEPLPYLADALCESIRENGLTATTVVHRVALDDRAGYLPLRHAPRTANFGGAHFASNTSVPEAHEDYVVETVRLDDIVGEQPCRFIKMDVEGAEVRIVRGARATLARNVPMILAELHDRQLRVVSKTSASDFIAEMSSLGYRCSRLTAAGDRGVEIDRYADEKPINVVFDASPPRN